MHVVAQEFFDQFAEQCGAGNKQDCGQWEVQEEGSGTAGKLASSALSSRSARAVSSGLQRRAFAEVGSMGEKA